MSTAKKVLSVVLSALIALSVLAVAASANGNKDTATHQIKLTLTADIGTSTINATGSKLTTTKTATGIESNDPITVNPGDTVIVHINMQTNYPIGTLGMGAFYSKALLDVNEFYQLKNNTTNQLTTTNLNKHLIFHTTELADEPEDEIYTSIMATGITAIRNCYSRMDDNNQNKLAYYPKDAEGNNTMLPADWHYSKFSTQPDPNLCEVTCGMPELGEFVSFPLFVPEDAAPGSTYKICIPEGSIRSSSNLYGLLLVQDYPDGVLNSSVPAYYNDDQYFDLDLAEINLVVAGATTELDYSELQTKYDAVKNTVLDNYTSETATPFSSALAAAATMLTNEDAADQDAINAALTALTNTFAALALKDASYTVLENALAAAADLNEDEYTADTWADLEAAVTAGNAVPAGLKITSQSTINDAAQAITDAITALQTLGAADYTALNAAIAEFADYVEEYYTSNTWSAYADAVTAGQNVDKNLKESQQSIITAATKAITDARDALVEADANYTALTAAKLLAADKNEDEYTEDSWADMQTALTAANAVATGLKARDQATIDAATKALTDAIAALQSLSYADLTQLQATIDAGTTYEQANYTDATWSAYATKLAEAEALVASKPLASQAAAVAQMNQDLIAAKAALELKGADYTAVDAALAKVPASYDNYVLSTVTPVVSAVSKVVRNKDITKQAEVDAMAKAIEDAIKGLQFKDASTAALEASVTKAEAVNSEYYTTDSYADLTAAIDAANAILNKEGLNITDQDDIDDAYDALEAAYEALEPLGADYSKLTEQISNYDALDSNNYTADSWADAKTAYDAAKVVAGTTYTKEEQATIDDATAALKTAIENLVEADADYTALTAKITEAKKLYNTQNKRNQYDPDTLAALEAAVKNGEDVEKGLKISAQGTIDALVTAIDDAIGGLVILPYDYTKINEIKDFYDANVDNKSDYTPETWDAFETKINELVMDYTMSTTDFPKAKLMESKLITAFNALVEADADYTALEAAILDAGTKDAAAYTPESWADMQTALTAANAVETGLKAKDQATIDTAKDNLLAAIDALVELSSANYDALEAALEAASKLNSADYTSGTWATLAAAVTAGEAVDPNLTEDDQDIIDAAAADITDAIAALVKKGNYTALDAAIARANALSQNEYTPETWADLATAVTAGTNLARTLSENEQTTIDAATKAITDAITALELREVVGAIVSVEWNSTVDVRKDYTVTVTGRANKVQFLEPDNGTRTYDRYNTKVTIVSYDAEDKVVNSLSTSVAYEVWTITDVYMPAGIDMRAVAIFDSGRENLDLACHFTITHKTDDAEIVSAVLEATSGATGKTTATITTGLDVTAIRLVYDNNTTATYYSATSTKVATVDGHYVFTLPAFINHTGVNTIVVKAQIGGVWQTVEELTYTAE